MFFFFLSNTDCSRIGFVIYYPCTFCEWRRDILPGLEACVPGWATAITFFVLFCHQMFFAFLSNIDCSRIGFVISYPPTFCDWRRDILTDLEAYVPGWETAIVFVLFCRQMFFAFLSNTDCSNIWFVICYLGTFCEWRRDILLDLEACVPGYISDRNIYCSVLNNFCPQNPSKKIRPCRHFQLQRSWNGIQAEIRVDPGGICGVFINYASEISIHRWRWLW